MSPMRDGRRPYRLPTYELPTGRQSRGRQFMVHQSTGLPTLIMIMISSNFGWLKISLSWCLSFSQSYLVLFELISENIDIPEKWQH